MFKEMGRDGLCYFSESGKRYDLLEGISSNGFTSDIIFIVDMNDLENQKIVNFVYGGFDGIQKDGIEDFIKEYEEKEKNKNER